MRITIVQGDITKQDGIDAIVNAARPSLLGGGGVDGAIHRAAGLDLRVACWDIPVIPESLVDVFTSQITVEPVRCRVGDARITKAYDLPNKWIIHTVGPKYDPDVAADMADILASAYRSSLYLAKMAGCRTVALPAISTGVYGYPMRDAALVAYSVLQESRWQFDEVRFVLFTDEAIEVFTEVEKYLQESVVEG